MHCKRKSAIFFRKSKESKTNRKKGHFYSLICELFSFSIGEKNNLLSKRKKPPKRIYFPILENSQVEEIFSLWKKNSWGKIFFICFVCIVITVHYKFISQLIYQVLFLQVGTVHYLHISHLSGIKENRRFFSQN